MRRKEVYDDRRATRTVFVTTAKKAGVQGFLWGLVFGATIAASASSYSSVFPSAVARARVALAFEGNTAWEALFGTIRRLDTVAGYTAYKSGMFCVILGSIWALLISTRLLRGEEDAGRWELYLSGHTTRAGAALQAVLGLGVGAAALWLPTFVLTAAAGASANVGIGVGAALFYATAIAAAVAMFMAIGLVVGQLSASRHDANLIGAAVLAGSYLIRMAGDSDAGLLWLRWASPLGWVEELRALTGSRPLAFLPIGLLVVILGALAVGVAGRRDLGAGTLARDEAPRPRLLLLGGQAGLTLRLTRPMIVGWIVAFVATGLVFGMVAQAAGSALRGARGLEEAIRRLGATASGAATYLGIVFVYAAVLVSVAVAGQVAAVRNEEAAGRLDNLLVRPVARWRWLGVRLAVGVGLVVAASVLVGLAAWAGAASQHAGIGIGELLRAGFNVSPPALFVLGFGALVFGLWPRGAIGAVYGLVVWSFLVEIIAAVFDSNHWLRDTSPLLHVAPVPAAPANVPAAIWLVGLGVLTAVVGLVAFGRRDVVGA